MVRSFALFENLGIIIINCIKTLSSPHFREKVSLNLGVCDTSVKMGIE